MRFATAQFCRLKPSSRAKESTVVMGNKHGKLTRGRAHIHVQQAESGFPLQQQAEYQSEMEEYYREQQALKKELDRHNRCNEARLNTAQQENMLLLKQVSELAELEQAIKISSLEEDARTMKFQLQSLQQEQKQQRIRLDSLNQDKWKLEQQVQALRRQQVSSQDVQRLEQQVQSLEQEGISTQASENSKWENLKHENQVLHNLVSRLRAGPAETVVQREYVTEYRYTHVDKLISYCKLLERVLEEHFDVQLSEEERRHKGLGVMINQAEYNANPISKDMRANLWKIAKNRNKLSHESDFDMLDMSDMMQVDNAWSSLQGMFKQCNVPESLLMKMTELEKKYNAG